MQFTDQVTLRVSSQFSGVRFPTYKRGKIWLCIFWVPSAMADTSGMIRQASQGSQQLSSPQPGRSAVRKKRTGQSGCGWSWAMTSSIAHSVQSPQARKVGEGAGTRWCPLAMVHCSSTAESQAGCGLQRSPSWSLTLELKKTPNWCNFFSCRLFKGGVLLYLFACIHVCACVHTHTDRHTHMCTFSFAVLSHTLEFIINSEPENTYIPLTLCHLSVCLF